MAENRRFLLDAELRSLLGSSNVYFQPPKSIMLHYPCIIYYKSRIDSRYADNKVYKAIDRYTLEYITKDPDDDMPMRILHHFSMVNSDRDFVSDNLHHYNFNLNY